MATYKEVFEAAGLLEDFKNHLEKPEIQKLLLPVWKDSEEFLNTDTSDLDPKIQDTLQSAIADKRFKKDIKEILNNENE